jgi:hypothetical protein
MEAGHRPNWRERAMFGHISNNHPFNYLYPLLFLARIIIFVAVIVFFHRDGFVQMLSLATINCLMLGFVTAYKPFKHRLRNQLAIINETTLVTATMTLFPFVYP